MVLVPCNTSRFPRILLVIPIGIMLAGCQSWQVNRLGDRMLPSNQRDWSPSQQVLPLCNFEEEQVTVSNIRRCDYLNAHDYVVDHYDRTFSIGSIQTVDFIVIHSNDTSSVSHTMLSFGLHEGSYLCVSIEGRTEKNEPYLPLLSISRKYEIIYVIGDEADLIGSRSLQPGVKINVYPSTATPEQSQALFLDVMGRVNELLTKPEFYDPLINSNKTNLTEHINSMQPGTIPFGWDALLPGFSARHAYDLGLIDNSVSFESLELLTEVTDLATQHYDTPEFSVEIRRRMNTVDRLATRNELRDERINSRGSQYLRQQMETPPSRFWR